MDARTLESGKKLSPLDCPSAGRALRNAADAFMIAYYVDSLCDISRDYHRRDGFEQLHKAAAVLGFKLIPLDAAHETAPETRDAAIAALVGLEQFFARPNENSIDAFERLAAVFRRETGYLRPGKDCRIHDDDVRRAAWEKWYAEKTAAARAALSIGNADGNVAKVDLVAAEVA